MDNILTVYSASAGSGKTFTLAVKYIELLIEQPENYRKILAVTFTNKATDEMKLRILNQLYGLAHSLPDSQAYNNKIKEDFHKAKKPISDELINGMRARRSTICSTTTIISAFKPSMLSSSRLLATWLAS